ncbi:MAG: hypothetical protein JEZ03_02500 [Bacteroidales bacterium]|nr:hypothetical protein [Bacteroidales bacterium]
MMSYKYIRLVTVLVLSVLFSYSGNTQDEEATYVNITFNTWKYTDGSRGLITKLTYDTEDGEEIIENLSVKYFVLNQDEEVLIGEVLSNAKGVAKLMLKSLDDLSKDDDGFVNFISRIEATKVYEANEESLMIKDARIEIDFELIDQEKFIQFKAFDLTSSEALPLPDQDIFFYTPRMFSDLKIAEGWLEEDGSGNVEFPVKIIGDENGNIEVIARIEGHDEYGNVEFRKSIDWASPKTGHLREGFDRELWTPVAPLWMIVTLILLLVGVWGHYAFAIIQLVRIKKSSK